MCVCHAAVQRRERNARVPRRFTAAWLRQISKSNGYPPAVRITFLSLALISRCSKRVSECKSEARRTRRWGELKLRGTPSSVGEQSETHSRGLVHFFVDLLDRQLDVELDAVEDVLEIRLLIHLKLRKHRRDRSL